MLSIKFQYFLLPFLVLQVCFTKEVFVVVLIYGKASKVLEKPLVKYFKKYIQINLLINKYQWWVLWVCYSIQKNTISFFKNSWKLKHGKTWEICWEIRRWEIRLKSGSLPLKSAALECMHLSRPSWNYFWLNLERN